VDLAIVIPAFNEAGNIAALIDEIIATPGMATGYEIIVVDDASTDNTRAVVSACATRHPSLRLVCHRRRCGQSAAIATGVDAATSRWIVTLDGDGQNDPADIPKLYAAMDDAAERVRMIAGYRTQREEDMLKRLASRIANATRRFLLRGGTPDSACGMKLFARETFLALPRFDHMHRFLPALVQRAGGQVVSLPVNNRIRQYGASKYGILDRLLVGIPDLLGVLWLQRRAACPEIEKGNET